MSHRVDDHDAAPAPALRVAVGAAVALAVVVGAVAALVVASLDYTLAYNDARARLVVARRVFDSLTPGLEQMGGIWLPLPHLLNLPLVQSDLLYRTGLGMVAINLAAFAALAAATVRIVSTLTGRPWAGFVAAAFVVSHPDVLYLQATPMTEVFALGLLSGAIALLMASGQSPRRVRAAAALLALAMLTRYEAWLVAAGVVAAVTLAYRGGDEPGGRRRHPAAILATVCVGAAGAALAWSRVTTGSWLVTSGFFRQTEVADRPLVALGEVARIAGQAAGPGLLILAGIGLVALVAALRRDPHRRVHLLAAAPLAVAALYWSTGYAGHSVLSRFGVFLLVPVIWLGVSGVVALRDAGHPRAVAVLVLLAGIWQAGVWVMPPVIHEAAVDVRNREGEAAVLEVLARAGSEDRVLASMWTAAPILHQFSALGVPLRRVVHEGNGAEWLRAMTRPAESVHWILVTCTRGSADRVLGGLSSLSGPLTTFDVVARSAALELYRARPGSEGPGRPDFCSAGTATAVAGGVK